MRFFLLKSLLHRFMSRSVTRNLSRSPCLQMTLRYRPRSWFRNRCCGYEFCPSPCPTWGPQRPYKHQDLRFWFQGPGKWGIPATSFVGSLNMIYTMYCIPCNMPCTIYHVPCAIYHLCGPWAPYYHGTAQVPLTLGQYRNYTKTAPAPELHRATRPARLQTGAHVCHMRYLPSSG